MLRKDPRRLLTYGALVLSAGIFLGVRLAFQLLWLFALGLSVLLWALLHAFKKPIWPGFLLSFFFCGVALCSYCAHPALPPASSAAARVPQPPPSSADYGGNNTPHQ